MRAPGSRHSNAGARRRRVASQRDPRAAFTLLELLISTAVGGIVLLVVQTAFFGALRLHNTTHAKNDTALEVQRALGILRRDLAGVMLPGGTLSGQLQTTPFSSGLTDQFGDRITPDIVTSSGRIDGWNGLADAQRVALFLSTPAERGGAGRDLIRVVTRNLLPVQEEPGEPQVLLRGVLEAQLEFFDGYGWTDTWDSEASETLPNAFKLRVVLAPTDPSQLASDPFELVVPVMVKTTASAAAEAEAAGEGAL
jgi:prepilin-type N-terminal cleavage/methylation domain-containing protein